MLKLAPTLEVEPAPSIPSPSARIRVVPRNHRWEVEVEGHTRPMIDWLCTRERATEHAVEQAADLLRSDRGSVLIAIEHTDHSVEQMLRVRGGESRR
jgi:hypothetical protein